MGDGSEQYFCDIHLRHSAKIFFQVQQMDRSRYASFDYSQ